MAKMVIGSGELARRLAGIPAKVLQVLRPALTKSEIAADARALAESSAGLSAHVKSLRADALPLPILAKYKFRQDRLPLLVLNIALVTLFVVGFSPADNRADLSGDESRSLRGSPIRGHAPQHLAGSVEDHPLSLTRG
jgi:hypothetical protein